MLLGLALWKIVCFQVPALKDFKFVFFVNEVRMTKTFGSLEYTNVQLTSETFYKKLNQISACALETGLLRLNDSYKHLAKPGS